MTDQIVALPLYEPMYINGQLSPTWAMFFDRLIETINALGANNGGGISDLQALMHALPNSSVSGQQSLIQQAVDAVELPTSQVITP